MRNSTTFSRTIQVNETLKKIVIPKVESQLAKENKHLEEIK
jgi:hypothetical protein